MSYTPCPDVLRPKPTVRDSARRWHRISESSYGLAEAYLDWISGRRRQGVELGGLTSPHPALPVL